MKDIDRYQEEYLAAYGFERHMVRYRRRQVLHCLEKYGHRHILEVGCGMEPLFEHIDDWETFDVVEPGSRFVEHARARAPEGRAVSLHEGFLEDVVARLSGPFDFIVASSLLHEVPDPRRFLATVHALCTADTVVHINVPNAASLHNRLAVHMGLIPDLFARSALAERMQRRGTYDMAHLVATVEQEGFSVVSSGTYFLKPFTHGQLQQMLEQEIINASVLDALFEVNAEFTGLGAELYVNAVRR